jgi:hypothetical protein
MQYKRVISFGDSFTWGTDLSDCNEVDPTVPLDVVLDSYSRKTWPALIAQHLEVDYECKAFPGSSNSTILRQILSAEILPTDLVIVNWTWIDRWDFYTGNDCLIREGWTTLRPNSNTRNDLHKFYYTYLQSELWDKFETLKNIHLAFSTLDNFISTAVDPLTVDKTWHCPSYVNKLIDRVSPSITWFNNSGFYNWAKDNGFPISDSWHPLELAHQRAFEYIRDNYDFTK